MKPEQFDVLRSALRYVDHLFVDDTVLPLHQVQTILHGVKSSLRTLHFTADAPETSNGDTANPSRISNSADLSALVDRTAQENVRVLAGKGLSAALGFDGSPALLMPSGSSTEVEWKCLPLRKTRVLHVVGSCTSEYYEGVSRYYATQCIESVSSESRFEHHVAYIHISGEWSVIDSNVFLQDLNSADRIPLHTALSLINDLSIDIVTPHMFDYMGMTAYRALFDVLSLPSIGCDADALALSTNKARTKAVAAMSGVRVPESALVRRGDDLNEHTTLLPAVVKPTEEDNSMGVTFVRDADALEPALCFALEFGDEALVERFVPLGRELRVGILERADGTLSMLPVIEYFLPEKTPIRTPADKVATGTDGLPIGLASGGRACPAAVDEKLRERLFDMASRAHRALGCRHYSIFDFRVDPDDVPFLLESCLYCSFAPKSALVTMADAAGLQHPQVFVELAERVTARAKPVEEKGKQKYGMKKRS